MKVLIFGGTGFLGKNLTDYLLECGHTVCLYVRAKTVKSDYLVKKQDKIKVTTGTFSGEQFFDDVIKDYDVVYQLISATVPSINDPLTDIDEVVRPTVNLMEACVRQKKRLIFFSSGGTVYGIPKQIPIKETHATEPISAYGIHKLSIEKYLEFYHRTRDLSYNILRISNPYGHYQRAFSNQGLIANILGNHLTGEQTHIWGDGGAIRDYICVRDVAVAAEKILHYQGNYHIFNIGAGMGYSINDVIEIIENIFKKRLNVTRTEMRKQDVNVNILDIALAERELDWKPQIDLEEGIRDMLKHWDEKNRNFNV